MSHESSRGAPLNGKPLVFVFMAATVVAVVIFLCGVMVGRGMQARLLAGADVPADPTRLAPRARPAGARLPGEVAPSTREVLTYAARLERSAAVPETLHEPVPPAPATAERAPQPTGRDEPSGPGLTVTVAAYPDRDAADTVANWLEAKGYPSYVSVETPGGQQRYVVRVGKYRTRREAEDVRARLASDEQLRAVITP